MANPLTYFLGSSLSQKPAPAALPSNVAPTFGGITGLSQNSDGSLTASWSAATIIPNPPVEYLVYVQASTATGLFSSGNLLRGVFGLNTRIYMDAAGGYLTTGVTYYVGVRAQDAYGNVETNVVSLSAAVTNANYNTLAAAVWDVVRSTKATVGTFGEALQSKVDVDVSTRAPAATALSNAVWTNARAVLQDNLDATVSSRATQASVSAIPTNPLLTTDSRLNNLDSTISSRAPAATALSTVQWTNTRAALLDYLDAAISSRAAAATALSTAQWTNARAALLDYLDATISSRAPSATALSTAQWTNVRAGYLDNLPNLDATVSSRAATADSRFTYLDAAISTRATQAAVTAIQNNTMFVGIVPELLILPDSGSKQYEIFVRLFNEKGTPQDPDSNVMNLTIKDVSGSVVVAQTAMTRDGSGQYHYFYTVNATDATRVLYVYFDYAVGSVVFSQVRATEVSPFQSDIDILLSRLTATRATLLDNLASLDAAISSRAPAATALSNADYTSTRAAKLDQLDAAVTSRAPAVTALSNADYTAARALKLDQLDAAVSSRATQTSVNAVKAQTDQFLFDGASNVKANAEVVSDKMGYSLTAAEELAIADKVWSALIGAYTNPAQAGYILNNLGAGSTPTGIAAAVWNAVRASYGASGSFGEALQGVLSAARALKLDYLDAAITSRASQASLDADFGNMSTLVSDLQTTSSNLQTTASETAATEVQLAADVADLGALNESISNKLTSLDPNAIVAVVEEEGLSNI